MTTATNRTVVVPCLACGGVAEVFENRREGPPDVIPNPDRTVVVVCRECGAFAELLGSQIIPMESAARAADGLSEAEVLALIGQIDLALDRFDAACEADDCAMLGRNATGDEWYAAREAGKAYHALLERLCAAAVIPGSAAGKAKAAWLLRYLRKHDKLLEVEVEVLIASSAGGA